jgi:hypothetical protein
LACANNAISGRDHRSGDATEAEAQTNG